MCNAFLSNSSSNGCRSKGSKRRKCYSERQESITIVDDDTEEALDPHGGQTVRFRRHVAIGDRRDVWFRCSLAFYDAIGRLSS